MLSNVIVNIDRSAMKNLGSSILESGRWDATMVTTMSLKDRCGSRILNVLRSDASVGLVLGFGMERTFNLSTSSCEALKKVQTRREVGKVHT